MIVSSHDNRFTTLYTHATHIRDEFVNKNNRTPLAASRPFISMTQIRSHRQTVEQTNTTYIPSPELENFWRQDGSVCSCKSGWRIIPPFARFYVNTRFRLDVKISLWPGLGRERIVLMFDSDRHFRISFFYRSNPRQREIIKWSDDKAIFIVLNGGHFLEFESLE